MQTPPCSLHSSDTDSIFDFLSVMFSGSAAASNVMWSSLIRQPSPNCNKTWPSSILRRGVSPVVGLTKASTCETHSKGTRLTRASAAESHPTTRCFMKVEPGWSSQCPLCIRNRMRKQVLCSRVDFKVYNSKPLSENCCACFGHIVC